MSLNRATLAGLISVSTLLTACGSVSTIPMDEASKSRIHSVSVDPNVEMPEEMSFLGRGEATALMLGGPIIGALIAHNTAATPKTVLAAEMQKYDISLGTIMAEEFAKQASSGSGMAFNVGTAATDAKVHLRINVYGLGQAQPFGATLYPLINVSAIMTAPDGHVVWQAMQIAGPLHPDNKTGHTYEEYVNDPALLRQAYVDGTDIASKMLTRNLMGLEKQSTPGIQQ